VLEDVRNGRVTPEAAERDYGVVVLPAPWRVDMQKTVKLRGQRGARPQGSAA
jgi:hypothetical protein